jgi:hypothetical protein
LPIPSIFHLDNGLKFAMQCFDPELMKMFEYFVSVKKEEKRNRL